MVASSILTQPRRGAYRMTVLALMAPSLVACVPVPSVQGRPASVLQEGQSSATSGGGGFYESAESMDDDPSEYLLGYYHFSRTWGVGHSLDLALGTNNLLQGYGAVRWQFLGNPLELGEGALTSGGGLDASLELGIAAIVPPDTYSASVYAGFSLSARCGRLTPYVSCQLHWGQTGWVESGGAIRTPYRHRMLFIGVERATQGTRTTVIELFHGATEQYDMDHGANITTYGINYLVRY
jgi:hypothetical protein